MIVKEIFAKSILSKSPIQDYALNPYVGCGHACRYCYAAFMRRFTGHKEKWGEFVDIRVNAPELLVKEIKKKPMGRVYISGVCDPYQPAENRYRLTARCLETLLEDQWPVTIQTKSSLVLQDIEILEKFKDIEVGFSITTEGKNGCHISISDLIVTDPDVTPSLYATNLCQSFYLQEAKRNNRPCLTLTGICWKAHQYPEWSRRQPLPLPLRPQRRASPETTQTRW